MNPIIPLFSFTPVEPLCQSGEQNGRENNRNVSNDGGRSLNGPAFLTAADCGVIKPLQCPPPPATPTTHQPPTTTTGTTTGCNDYNKCEGEGSGRGAFTCTLHLVHSDMSQGSLIMGRFLTPKRSGRARCARRPC